jgi:hypothetical protein
MENTMENPMDKIIQENQDRKLIFNNPKLFFIAVVNQRYEDEVLGLADAITHEFPYVNKEIAFSSANGILAEANSLRDSIINFINSSSGGYKKLNKTTKTKQHRKKSRKTLRK